MTVVLSPIAWRSIDLAWSQINYSTELFVFIYAIYKIDTKYRYVVNSVFFALCVVSLAQRIIQQQKNSQSGPLVEDLIAVLSDEREV